MKKLLWALVSQDGALANARAASTSLSARRVEREGVELFLERMELRAAARESMPATAAREAAPR